MGHYVAVHMDFPEPNRVVEALRAAARCDAFSPKAIRAITMLEKGSAIETVAVLGGSDVEIFSGEGPKKIDKVSVIASSDENRQYLESFVNSPRRSNELGPFEKAVPDYDTTLLASPPLVSSVWDVCATTVRAWQRPSIHLYGTFRLAVRNPGPWDWSNAWREIVHFGPDDEPAGRQNTFMRPFVTILATVDVPDTVIVMLISNSQIWLREAGSLRGRIGPEEADENLRNLAQLASVIANNGQLPFRHATLTLDGNPFWAEADRIQEAFAKEMPFTYEV